MKGIFFSVLFMFNFSFFQNGQKPIAKELKKMFVRLSLKTDSIYLADTIYLSGNSDYEEAKDYVAEKDTLLLKAIIDSGSREIISPQVIQSLLLPYKVRILSRKEFNAVEVPEPMYDHKEDLVLGEIDSLERYINMNSPDSLEFHRLFLREGELMRSKSFKSYIHKRERSRKRMMYFYPFIRFRNYVLMEMTYYNSLTNNATIIKIFPG